MTFRLLEAIGHGTDGTIYRAVSAGRPDPFAVKLFAPGGDPALPDRLRRQVALSQSLGHAGLIRLHGCGHYEDRPFLAMDLVEGPTLKTVLAEAPLAPARCRSIVLALAGALAALHGAGVVHRDVKPGNIILRNGGDPVLLDLCAAALDPSDRAPGTDLVGSPAYLAPEVIGDRPSDGRADIFSLGVILYQMLTGRRPFTGTVEQVMAAIRHDDPAPSGLGAEWDGLLGRMLSKQPQDRPTAFQLSRFPGEQRRKVR